MKPINPLELTIVERLQLEDEFFKTPFLMSYSGLNKLAYSPGAFYQHYVLKQREDSVEKSMIEGKAIHCMLLTPEIFDDFFTVMPEEIPSDNPKTVLDRVYRHMMDVHLDFHSDMSVDEVLGHEHFRNSILDVLRDENLYQSLKTDPQRLDKMLTDRNVSYFMYLLRAGDRTVIDQDTFAFVSRSVQECKQKLHLRELFGMDEYFKPGSVHNELTLVSFPGKYSFGLKGIIDNLVIDHKNNVIRINDVKKSSKPLSSFHDSIDYYKYWIQASIYSMMVSDRKVEMFNVDYPVEFRFVVIDPYMQVGVIKVSEETLEKWMSETDNLLTVAEGHFQSKNFSLPLHFLTSDNHEHVI